MPSLKVSFLSSCQHVKFEFQPWHDKKGFLKIGSFLVQACKIRLFTNPFRPLCSAGPDIQELLSMELLQQQKHTATTAQLGGNGVAYSRRRAAAAQSCCTTEKIIFSSSIRFLRRSSITRWHSMCTMVIRALRSSFSRVVEILRTPDSSPFNPYQNSDRSIPISLMKNFRDEEVVVYTYTYVVCMY